MRVFMCALVLAMLVINAGPADAKGKRSRWVTATAYTSRPSEITHDVTKKTACGDHLSPKTKGQTIAVSLDLVRAGLDCGMVVTVVGLSSGFVVTDHLPSNVRNHIDIFVGKDVKMAKNWGRRKVKIIWRPLGPVK